MSRQQMVPIILNKNYERIAILDSYISFIWTTRFYMPGDFELCIDIKFADILQRNGLPHYRFYVTSVLRTQDDVKHLQESGNINATTNSCHCYGTTFDLAYYRYDKVTHTHEYMHEDNLKLVLGQALLNHQRAGKIYVKYEHKQACFHVTVRK